MTEFVARDAIPGPVDAKTTRRDFLYQATGAMAGIGALAASWPLIDQMNPAQDAIALATEGIDISAIQTGQTKTVVWQGKPIFIRARTPQEIEAARSTPIGVLRHPQSDFERVVRDPWLVMVGLCTHLPCVPYGNEGEHDGWYCVCCSSHYDTSGRVRKGPAPKNMVVPRYVFLDDSTIRIDGFVKPELNCCSELMPEYLSPSLSKS